MSQKTLSMFALIAALLSSALLPTVALAQRVDVRLEDRTLGRNIPLHRHDGRLYAAGEPGHRYAIRLSNRSGERVLAVVSVDGVNVVTGQTAHPQQSGYVLDPWQSMTINGWRKNMDEIAAFNFAPLPESYAARTGRPNDVGVIGVAVFNEARYVHQFDEEQSIARPQAAPSAPFTRERSTADSAAESASGSGSAKRESNVGRSQRDERLGTGHGERERSHARRTEFVRASTQPAEVNSIWYDSRRNLIASGVLPRPHRHLADREEPRAFPGFVPDPW
jgi:hypothetical protein